MKVKVDGWENNNETFTCWSFPFQSLLVSINCEHKHPKF